MSIDIKATQSGYQLPPVVKKITEEMMCNYSNRYPGVFISTIHTNRDAAAGWGFPDLVLQGSQTMNFGAEILFKVYREHWINSSSLTVKFIKPVFCGDTVTTKATVRDRKATEDGKGLLTIDVWAENASGDKIMTGEATITV